MSTARAGGWHVARQARRWAGHALGQVVRRLARLRFELLHRRTYGRRHLARVAGLELMVEAGVFPPALFGSSALLAGYLAEVPLAGARRALDLGTGCGLCALALARRGLAVVATDINPRALACARENAARLGLGARVAFRLGSVFEPVAGERFDLICSNPPFYRGQPADPLDAAWRSPDFLDQLAVGLGAHLAPGGRAYLVLSSDLGLPAYRQQLASANLGMREVKRTGLVGERLVVWEVARR